MLRKSSITIFLFLLFSFLYQSHLIALEPKPQYFGVDATIQDADTGEHIVKTKGMKAGEGFVYTPQQARTKQEITYQIDLKGKGPVILKISETDASGRFIKEEERVVELTEQWTTYEMPYTLQSTTSQLDVFVLTKDKSALEFSFKNLRITD